MTGVSQILAQLAENAGKARLVQGQIYGNAVAAASQVPAQILDDQERQQQIDFQRARDVQQMGLALRADQRATADQAYQDQARATQVAHDQAVRAGLTAAMGPDGDPTVFDAGKAWRAVSALGRPDAMTDVINIHQAIRGKPLFKKQDETGVDPNTYAPIPGLEATPKIPEMGTPGYEIYLRSLANQPAAAPGAPASSAAPPVGVPTYAGRADLLQHGPPPSPVPAGGPGAPSTVTPPAAPAPALAAPAAVSAFDAGGGGTFAGPTTYGPAPASIPPPIGTPPAAAAPARPLTPNEATLKAYADQRKAIEDAKDPHSAPYKEWQDYKAQGGDLAFDAYMTMDANRKKPVVSLSGMNALYQSTDPKGIADGIRSGTFPPDISQYGRPVQGAIASELAKQGFDLSRAQTDWKATQKHIATLNGAQQLRLNQAVNALPDMLDSVDALAAKWQGGQFPILNRANLALAKGGAYGKDVASVANQLDAQIADVTADLGNVYMGGNSPTDHALGLAGKSLSGDWDQKVLHDMVQLAKKNVTIRQNSIANTGVAGASATNPYAAPAPAAAPTAPIRQPIPGMPGALAESTDGGKTWKRVQ